MKLGALSAILGEQDFESMIDTIATMGYRSVEAACWPKEKAERRYAGICHIDVKELSAEKANYYLEYCRQKQVEIAALAYYPNCLSADSEKRGQSIRHLYHVIDAAALLGCRTVTTFIGRDQTKSIGHNMELFERIWPEIIRYAESREVRIAIENCPMLFDETQWPGGQNLAVSPSIWREMFRIIPSKYFGICYDPSHFVWQQIDYIKPIEEFQDRIFHVHCKDIKVYPEKLKDVGVLAYPLQYMAPKIPGLGDVRWGTFISALTDIGYQGNICVEVEDRAFESSSRDVLNALKLSKRYLDQFII